MWKQGTNRVTIIDHGVNANVTRAHCYVDGLVQERRNNDLHQLNSNPMNPVEKLSLAEHQWLVSSYRVQDIIYDLITDQ